MSNDEMISIPSFLTKTLTATRATACSWCSEISCETDSMGTCSNGCQTTCEGTCQTSCQSSGCQSSCQFSCQSGQECYEACPSGRQGCYTTCESSCQNCEGSACLSSCQGMLGGAGGCDQCDACMATNQGLKPMGAGEILEYSSTATTITIRFVAISNASYYTISYRVNGASETTYVTSDSTTYTITGLKPDTEYVVNYRGDNQYGSGPFMPSGVVIKTKSGSGCRIYSGGWWHSAVPHIYNSGWHSALTKIRSGDWHSA